MANSKIFAGRAPGGRGGMVELRDGRWIPPEQGIRAIGPTVHFLGEHSGPERGCLFYYP